MEAMTLADGHVKSTSTHSPRQLPYAIAGSAVLTALLVLNAEWLCLTCWWVDGFLVVGDRPAFVLDGLTTELIAARTSTALRATPSRAVQPFAPVGYCAGVPPSRVGACGGDSAGFFRSPCRSRRPFAAALPGCRL
jgi:hypothetical protein